MTEASGNAALADATDFADFFGGDWDFSLNGTFTDLKAPPPPPAEFGSAAGQPVLSASNHSNTATPPSGAPPSGIGEGHASAGSNINNNHLLMMTGGGGRSAGGAAPPAPQIAGSGSGGKLKPPNLYETLRRSQMMSSAAPLMMTMSPIAALNDGTYMASAGGGLDWSPPLLDAGAAGLFAAGSPTMGMAAAGLDPSSAQALNMMLMQSRLKRARVSPIIGASNPLDPTGMMTAAAATMGPWMGVWPRTLKMPLSPMSKAPAERSPSDSSEQVGKTMPLVLPHAAGNTKSTHHHGGSATNYNTLLPYNDGGPGHKASAPPGSVLCGGMVPPTASSLEEGIQNNLRAFLEDTKELVFEQITVQDLKRILRKYELNATGKKGELFRRIQKIRAQYQQYTRSASHTEADGAKDIVGGQVPQQDALDSLWEPSPHPASFLN